MESTPTPQATQQDLTLLDRTSAVTDLMRLMDRTARSSAAFLGLNHRVAEAEAKTKYPGLAPAGGEDEMNVFLNSPITIQPKESETVTTTNTSTTNPIAAVAKAAAPFWQKALVSAAMLAGGVGLGAGIPWLLGAFDKPAAVATPTFEDTNTQYELRLGTGEETPTPAK